MNSIFKKLISVTLAVIIAAGTMCVLGACDKTEEPEDPAYADSDTADGTADSTEDTTEDIAEDTAAEDTTAEQEIIGQGTETDPYLAIPSNMVVKTNPIPAGATAFYAIYRTGGKILVINDENAYVNCEGNTYNAEEGVVTFKVPDALASEAVLFEVGNKGDAEATFEIQFSDIPGSMESPIVVESLDGEQTVSIPEETTQGYHYVYTAEKAGKISIKMTASVEAGMTVDRVRGNDEVYQLSTADNDTSADGSYTLEVEVNEGDELRIAFFAVPNKRGSYPAVDITWSAEYN